MSSSAFTPTTTQVTTEVPVNVPVVTDWVAYTPTLTNFGSKGTTRNEASWRRVGADIQIKFSYTGDTTAAGAGASVLLMSLPSGLTFDSSQSPTPGSLTDDDYFGNYREYAIATNATYSSVQQVFPNSSTTFRFVKQGTGGSLTTSDINVTRAVYITGEIRAPIAEWAGSGTTTLADRAVEEYAWNSDPGTAAGTTYSTSTFYGYGPQGTPIVAVNSTTASGESKTLYTVQFQTPVLSTDSIVLEFNDGNGWFPASSRIPGIGQGFSSYGATILATSSTTYRVAFGNAGYIGSNPTYAGAGAAWSALAGASWRWRLRKISGGAAVGFPVSARNIVGDTSGSVVPVGMLGERLTTGVISTNITINTTNTDLMSLSITAGTWLICTRGTISYTSGTGLNDRGNVACWVTDGTSVYGQITPAYAKTMVSGNQNASVSNASFNGYITTSTSKTLTWRAVRIDIQNTSSATAGLEASSNGAELFAIRIA
jgi:hypothetical protein